MKTFALAAICISCLGTAALAQTSKTTDTRRVGQANGSTKDKVNDPSYNANVHTATPNPMFSNFPKPVPTPTPTPVNNEKK